MYIHNSDIMEKEYDMTFVTALRHMLDGAIMECDDDDSPYRLNQENSHFEWYSTVEMKWYWAFITKSMQRAGWRFREDMNPP